MGVLYLREGAPFQAQQTGGSQEDNRRAGTENVAGIVGTAAALKRAVDNRDAVGQHCKRLRDRLLDGILTRIADAHLNGHPVQRLPNNANISFDYVEGESILLNLDLLGVAASSGSACASGHEEPSHVLLAIGLPGERAYGSVRFTVGEGNTDEDVDYVLHFLPGIIERLRKVSPLAGSREQDRGASV